MKVQSYKNHTRYYAPHHFVFYPLIGILTFTAGYKIIKAEGEMQTVWLFITLILVFVIAVSFLMRQHYALTLQNRLVRLEMRHKYGMLTGKDFESIEERLSFKQIAALRFASDEELVALVAKTVKENLPPQEIKKTITLWKADANRV